MEQILDVFVRLMSALVVWKLLFAIIVIISGIVNVACWILEAVAVWDALTKDESAVRKIGGFQFSILPKIEMIVILLGVALVIIGTMSLIYAQLPAMIILGIVGVGLLAAMSSRVKKVALAIFYLVLDMGAVILIRALVIGGGASEALVLGTSIVALLTSVAITKMREGTLIIEGGRYVFRKKSEIQGGGK